MRLASFFCLLLMLALTGCNDDDSPSDYQEWKNRNTAYIDQKKAETNPDGTKVFETVVPDFAPGTYVLMRWDNDRSLTAGNLSPMDNSTVNVNYRLTDIDGKLVDGHDDFVTMPQNTVIGFWSALTHMKVGDTVTAVVPCEAGYGDTYYGSIKPYTTLIFTITLNSIVGYEIKH